MDVLFCGRKDVSVRCLEWLAGRDGVRVTGVLTDSHLAASPTAAAARRLGIPLLVHEEVCPAVEAGTLRFDLCVSMLYWRIFKGCFLDHPRLGTINFHPAPLPEYRGCGGYNLAILEGREAWGVSVHYVDEGVDTGEIIEVDDFPIDRDAETVVSLEATCRERLFDQFVRVLSAIQAADARLPTTPNTGGRHVSRREMEAMKEIRDGDDVARKVRAFWFPPYEGAWIELDGKRYTLIDEAILRTLAPDGSTSLFTQASKGAA